MNAYELADELQKLDARLHLINLFKSADMLRQQADRIAELEKLLEQSIGSDCREMRYIQEIENKDAKIAGLEKQYRFGVDWGKDDKSVTVVKIHEDGVAEIVFVDYQERPTPQTKPLSDEEIQETWESLFENEDDIVHIHNFARAIEAKVRGEK